MPVICPTCQIFCVLANAFLFKSLDRRCGLVAGNRFGSFGNWRRGHAGNRFGSLGNGRRTNLGGRLFPGSNAGLSCMPGPRSRCGSPHSPGTRDRGPCRISNERACHRAHRSQDDRSRHCPQGSISGTILGSCFGRHKRPCDQGANKQFLHRGSPRMRREGTGLRNCGGTKVMRPTGRRQRAGRMGSRRRAPRRPIQATTISDSKSPRPVCRRGLNSCDVVGMPVICPTCQVFCVRVCEPPGRGRSRKCPPDERRRKGIQSIDMVARRPRLHTNSRQRQHPLKDRRQANQHHKQFEKICQTGFADKFIDGPKANCTDDANNQNPDQD